MASKAVEKRWKVKLERHGLSAGATFVMATSRDEARERAAERHPDCVVVSASVARDLVHRIPTVPGL